MGGTPSLSLFCLPLGLVLFSLAACERPLPGQLAPCRVYRPHIAKRTFDGRVGAVLLRNASSREVEVKLYHPDGFGDAELRWPVAAGAVLAMQGAVERGSRWAMTGGSGGAVMRGDAGTGGRVGCGRIRVAVGR